MRRLIAIIVVIALLGGTTVAWRPWIVGNNPLEPVGSSLTEGYEGRVTDPVTGAGLMNANTDPNIVGVDPLTGSDSPSGVDVGFGGPLRRFILTGVMNGDFALGPEDPSLPLLGDTADAAYNPLPYFRTSMVSTIPVAWSDGNATPSGALLTFTLDGAGASDETYLEQIVPVANAQDVAGEHVPVLTIESRTAGTVFVRAQYLKADGTTTTGSEREATATASGVLAIAATTVPDEAYWMRLRFGVKGSGTGTVTISEVRLQRTMGQLGRQEFTTAGDHTWYKPADATVVQVLLVGGGGGGGSGRRGAAGTNRYGGGGGGGGGMTIATFRAADLPSTVTVSIGTGGTGGPNITTNDTNGEDGEKGTESIFNGQIAADGGAKGIGGTTANGTGGAGAGGSSYGNDGGSSSVSGSGDAGGQTAAGAGGGGAGGGIDSAGTYRQGGGGGIPVQVFVGGAARGIHGTSDAEDGSTFGDFGGGGGGGGSAGAGSTVGRAGGDGVRGGGGGGGSALVNGTGGNGGGNGGDGYCLVIAW